MSVSDCWTMTKYRTTTWLLLMTLTCAAGLASCDDGSTQPEQSLQDATEVFDGLVVSDVVSLSGSGAALAASSAGVTYISACPGTFPNAKSLTVTNPASGSSQRITIKDGGFDPVGLAAEPGDRLEIVLRHMDGSTSSYVTLVPARKRPRVVRTAPPRDATQVRLSASAVIVFSEPVDPSTVTTENVQLQRDGELVDGTLVLSDDGLTVDVITTDLLRPATTYTLVITGGVRDLDGDPLDEELRSTFSTETLGDRPVELGTLDDVYTICRARDLSEPLGDTLLVVGGCGNGESYVAGYELPTAWKVSLDAAVGVDFVEITALSLGDFTEGFAKGINDDGDHIAGQLGIDWETEVPAVWFGSNWTLRYLTPLPEFDHGTARDVNDDGTVVGWSRDNLGFTLPTRWQVTDPAQPEQLPTPLVGGTGRALGVNNQGYVVGEVRTINPNSPPWHAILWRPDGSYCDLHQWGESRSLARGITDVFTEFPERVLVAGWWESQAVVWDVDLTDCSMTVTMIEEITYSSSQTYSWDIRALVGGWEVAGDRYLSGEDPSPARWSSLGSPIEWLLPTLTGVVGQAYGINDAGYVIGWTEGNESQHAVLWIE